MNQASYEIAEFKAVDGDGPAGLFAARVSVFGNVDRNGDRVMPGAFAGSLAKWQASGKPIPVIWSHEKKDPDAYIGEVWPNDVLVTDNDVAVAGKLFVENNPKAAKIHELMKRGLIGQWSFSYSVNDERIAADKAREIYDLDLYELGPTLVGANPDTATLAVKEVAEAESLPVEAEVKLGAAVEQAISHLDAELDELVETKIGRVISRRSEAKIRGAISQLTELLSSLDKDEEVATAPDDSPSEEKAVEEPAPLSETEIRRRDMERLGLFLSERNR